MHEPDHNQSEGPITRVVLSVFYAIPVLLLLLVAVSVCQQLMSGIAVEMPAVPLVLGTIVGAVIIRGIVRHLNRRTSRGVVEPPDSATGPRQ